MEDLSNDKEIDVKLQIAFPKSNEDHRLQLVEINGSIFAIVYSSLESNGPIRLDCQDWSLILLAPIKSQSDIMISAINLICLSEVESKEGKVDLHANKQLVKFPHLIKPFEKVSARGEGGEFDLPDDPAVLLQNYKLLNSVIESARKDSSESLAEAQKKFVVSLCILAEKIEGKSENLNLKNVLDLWSISYSNL